MDCAGIEGEIDKAISDWKMWVATPQAMELDKAFTNRAF